MIRLPVLKSRQPNPAKLRVEEAAPEKRWAGHVDIKIDVAACIRGGLGGLAILILAVAAILNPDQGPIPLAAKAISGVLAR